MPDTPETPGVPGDVPALHAEITRLREAGERLRMLLEDKDAVIAHLRARNTELEERVARLERLISRNSGNSSMPPSTDDLPGKKPPRREGKQGGGSKRKPGKQPGAPGAYLAWNEDPDKTENLFPEGTCGCGADLAGAADRGVRYSHQVTDLPEAKARTTQYDRHEVQCSCGRTHVADAPPEASGAPGTVTYGLNFQAWCVFLMVMHHVPVERCADIIASMSGTRPSDGWVHALLGRAARAVAAANKTIRALIILAHVLSADETPIRVGPGPKTRKRYLLVACTNLLTYYFLGDRSARTFAAFHAANTARASGLPAIPEDIAGPLIKAFRHGVILGLGQVKKMDGRKQAPCRDLLEDLRDREDDVLRFTRDLRIPPTSNQAERDLRPSKTQQKISGRLRSEETTRHRYAIRGYASTADKHGTAVFTAIRDALAGNPWIPPIPAAT